MWKAKRGGGGGSRKEENDERDENAGKTQWLSLFRSNVNHLLT